MNISVMDGGEELRQSILTPYSKNPALSDDSSCHASTGF